MSQWQHKSEDLELANARSSFSLALAGYGAASPEALEKLFKKHIDGKEGRTGADVRSC